MSALVNGDGAGNPELVDMVLRDLAAVHGVTVKWLQQYYKPGDYFAWDWLHNPFAMGSSVLPMDVLTLLNGYFRRICVLWPGCIRGR